MSWYNMLKGLITTRQLEAELRTAIAECDALKQANAALVAENLALKEQIADERKSDARPLSFRSEFPQGG